MITVAGNNKYLEKDGKFFPYLADTAWTLMQRLSRREIIYYLDVRKGQGFNAVQVSAISELDGINTPNKEGNKPFSDGDVYKPCKEYFDLLLFLIDECEKRDIVLTLLPTWGDKFNKKWGMGPEIFTPENAGFYGEYLASLIDCHENIIFMLGGDRPIENEIHRAIIDSMAAGLKRGERVKHLITYHPCGEASSYDFLGDCEYIDFNSIQSGHSFGGKNSEKMLADVIKKSEKPCLDAECFYEDFPLDFNTAFGYRFNSFDIRERIFKNMLAGSLGTVYGHQSVWCFNEREDYEYLFDWKSALLRPMANSVKSINNFLLNVDLSDVISYNNCYNCTCVIGKNIIVVLTENQSEFCVKLPLGRTPNSAKWFNTENGQFYPATVEKKAEITLKSPFDMLTLLVIDF